MFKINENSLLLCVDKESGELVVLKGPLIDGNKRTADEIYAKFVKKCGHVIKVMSTDAYKI